VGGVTIYIGIGFGTSIECSRQRQSPATCLISLVRPCMLSHCSYETNRDDLS
jgi:hypothetical protein